MNNQTFIIEIEPNTQILDIETSFIENINNIEIENYQTFNLEIINTEKILFSDLPDIFLENTFGNINVGRISGLDNYLDHYNFDCGTP
jgi:hypothetical protein